MTALCIILGLLLLIGFTKVSVVVKWNGELILRLKIGPISFSLLKEKVKSESQSKSAGMKKKRNIPLGKLLLSNWRDVLRLISQVLHAPVLERFVLHVVYGGKDHADAALHYGRSCAFAGALMPFMEQLFHIRKKDVQLRYDCEQTGTEAFADAELSIRIAKLIVLAAALLRFAYGLYKEIPNT